MRGDASSQTAMLLAVSPDQMVPADHPIRRIRPIVERALAALAPSFAAMYAPTGRPSIPPEHLLKGSLLIALYSIRSERQFCERLQYDPCSSGSSTSTSPIRHLMPQPSPRTGSG